MINPLHILVARGAHDDAMGVPKTAVSVVEHKSHNGVVIIPRSCDTVQPLALVIESEEDPFLNNYTDYLELEIGRQDILKLSLSILRSLSTDVKRIRNKHIMMLDWNAFFPDIPVLRLYLHEIQFTLRGEGRRRPFSMLVRETYLDSAERREFNNLRDCNEHTQGIACSEVFHTAAPATAFDFRFDTYAPLKGLFIETGDACDLTGFELFLNGDRVIDLNDITLAMVAKRLSPMCVYVPFNFRAQLMSRDPSSFAAGAINFSRIDLTRLKLVFDTPQTNIRLSGFVYNSFRSMSGMGGLQFATTTILLDRWVETVRVNRTIVHGFNLTNPIPKSVREDRNTCPITLNVIQLGELFVQCSTCSHIYDAYTMSNWFSQSGQSSKCSLCRSPWCDWNVYVSTAQS